MTYGDIWSELEAVPPASSDGYLIRRVRPDARCDLFLAVAKPSNQRMLLLHFQTSSDRLPSVLPAARGIDVKWGPAEVGKSGASLQIALLDGRFTGMFSQLVADLVDVAASALSDSAAAAACIGRLERWQRFLEHAGDDGLGREAQQGLFGELWFLREQLMRVVSASVAVNAWTGPSGAAQDFQLQGCAIEVKTTTATEPRSVFISNERQLDDIGLRALFLFALIVESRHGAGETLNELISALRTALAQQADMSSQDRFEERLLEAGYLQAHAPRYEGTGYLVHEANLFRVRNGFPRITGTDLRAGVGNVRYSITLSACHPFISHNDALTQMVMRPGNDG